MAIIHDYTIFIPYYTYTRRWINWAIRHAADLIFLVVILLGWWVIFTISNRNSYQTTSLKSPCFMVNSPNFGWTSCAIKSSHVGIMFLIHLKNPSKFTLKIHHGPPRLATKGAQSHGGFHGGFSRRASDIFGRGFSFCGNKIAGFFVGSGWIMVYFREIIPSHGPTIAG